MKELLIYFVFLMLGFFVGSFGLSVVSLASCSKNSSRYSSDYCYKKCKSDNFKIVVKEYGYDDAYVFTCECPLNGSKK